MKLPSFICFNKYEKRTWSVSSSNFKEVKEYFIRYGFLYRFTINHRLHKLPYIYIHYFGYSGNEFKNLMFGETTTTSLSIYT